MLTLKRFSPNKFIQFLFGFFGLVCSTLQWWLCVCCFCISILFNVFLLHVGVPYCVHIEWHRMFLRTYFNGYIWIISKSIFILVTLEIVYAQALNGNYEENEMRKIEIWRKLVTTENVWLSPELPEIDLHLLDNQLIYICISEE